MKNKKPFIGIIGGSGLYDLDELINPKWKTLNSSFGSPSDDILTGKIGNINLAFLPRHGRQHNRSRQWIEQSL